MHDFGRHALITAPRDRPVDAKSGTHPWACNMLLGAVPDQMQQRVDPFWSALANSRAHPRSVVAIQKDIGSMFGLMHLTQDELVGPRQSRPAAAPLFPGGADSDQLPAYAGVGTVGLFRGTIPTPVSRLRSGQSGPMEPVIRKCRTVTTGLPWSTSAER